MILEELTLHNFGAFKGEHSLALTPNNVKQPIVIIGAQNGSGKTTILEALQLVLYGRQAPYLQRERKAYDRYLREMIHRGVSPKDGAQVRLRFSLIEDGESITYEICRTWSGLKKMTEALDVSVNGAPDAALAENWNQEVYRFLPPNLAEFFFFDGEKIDALANPTQSGQILRLAIHALLGISLIDKLRTDLKVLVRRKQQEILKDDLGEEVLSLESQIDVEEKRLRAAIEHQAVANTALDRAETLYARACDEFTKHGGDVYEQRGEIERRKASLTAEHGAVRQRLTEISAGAAPFLLIRDKVDSLAEQASQEGEWRAQNILRSGLRKRDQRFLTWLKSEYDDKALLKAVSRYFETETQALEKAEDGVLGLSSSDTAALKQLSREQLPDVRNQINQYLAEDRRLRSEMAETDRALARVPSNDQIAQLLEMRATTKTRLAQCVKDREKIETEIAQIRFKSNALDQQRNRLLERRAAIKSGNSKMTRIIEHSQKARTTLTAFRTALVERRISALEEFIVARLRLLLRKDSLIRAIRIDREDYTPELFDSENRKVPLERLSAGESQLLAIAILWGLSEATGKSLPVVVDTPLARLDRVHRNRLVEQYFPNASHQVLLLSTDTEIDATLYKRLGDSVSHAYLLDHQDKGSSTAIRNGYFGEVAA